uniref:Uncharacterized protein n=1 Tax=Steinernema glaseri TaxID=37863 RepID=A0A1I8A0G2_9BILA
MDAVPFKFAKRVLYTLIRTLGQTDRGFEKIQRLLAALSGTPGIFGMTATWFLHRCGVVDVEIFFGASYKSESYLCGQSSFFGNPRTYHWKDTAWKKKRSFSAIQERIIGKTLLGRRRDERTADYRPRRCKTVAFKHRKEMFNTIDMLKSMILHGLGGRTLRICVTQAAYVYEFIKQLIIMPEIFIKPGLNSILMDTMAKGGQGPYTNRCLVMPANTNYNTVERALRTLPFVKYVFYDVELEFTYKWLKRLLAIWKERTTKSPVVKLTLRATKIFYNAYLFQADAPKNSSQLNRYVVYDEMIDANFYTRVFMYNPYRGETPPSQYNVDIYFVKNDYSWLIYDEYFDNREHYENGNE